MQANFILHPQLQADTHCLLDGHDLCILLHKNASIPWLILVPKTSVTEIYQLPTAQLKSLHIWLNHIAEIFGTQFGTEKMNIAAIGNVVAQLHIHAIGRKPTDACWPGVVWGADYSVTAYSTAQIKQLKTALMQCLTAISHI